MHTIISKFYSTITYSNVGEWGTLGTAVDLHWERVLRKQTNAKVDCQYSHTGYSRRAQSAMWKVITLQMYINSTHQPLNLLLYLFREPKAAASCLEQLLRETKPSRQTGHIIGSLLMRTKTFNLSLRSLVEWPLWPPILKAYSKLRDCSRNTYEFSV